jgi:hypothetical protein
MWAIAPITLAVCFAVSFLRKGSVHATTMTPRRLHVSSSGDPDVVFARLATIIGVYRVDDQDPRARILVLSSPASVFSWGFFYPVIVRPEGAGCTIEIGIRSKIFQVGPVVGHAHNRCKEAIERVLSLPQARLT